MECAYGLISIFRIGMVEQWYNGQCTEVDLARYVKQLRRRTKK